MWVMWFIRFMWSPSGSYSSINLGGSVKDYVYVTSGATGQVRFEVSTDGTNFSTIWRSQNVTRRISQHRRIRCLHSDSNWHLLLQSSLSWRLLNTWVLRVATKMNHFVKSCKKTTCTTTCLSACSITLGKSVTDLASVTLWRYWSGTI